MAAASRRHRTRELTGRKVVRLYDGLSYGLEAAAGLASRADRPEETARLLGAADVARVEVTSVSKRVRRGSQMGTATSSRSPLGDELFDARWEEGRALGFYAALEQARRTLRPAEATGAS